MIFALFITLFILSIISYYINKKDLIAPSFLFSLSFLSATFFALLNDKKWAVNLSTKTYLVIVGGVLEFILVSSIVNFFFSKSYSRHINLKESISLDKNFTWKMVIIEVIQVVFIVFIAKEIKTITGQANIITAINLFNSSTNGFIDLDFTLPTYIKLMQTFLTAFGVFGEYLFANAIVIKKQFNLVLFLETLIGLFAPLLNGSRGGTIFGLITLFVFLYMLKQDNTRLKSNAKYVIGGMILVGIVLILLQWSATLVGREVDSIKPVDYISTYIGAEIKNLDIFINQSTFPIDRGIWGQQTFYTIINFLIKHLHFAIQPYNLDLPFRISNGYGLGNVATTFYPWLYDFGYVGVFWLTLIMAVISEAIYKITRNNNKLAPIPRLFYGGTIVPCIIFSFFSNKFYESMDIIFIALSIIIWSISNHFFSKSETVK